MKIYLVIESELYEGSEVVAIHATKRGALRKAISLRAAQWTEYYERSHRRVMSEGYGRGEKIHWQEYEIRPSRRFTIQEAVVLD